MNGIYSVKYRAVLDGREYFGSRNVEVIDPVVTNFSSYDIVQSYTVMNDGYYQLEVWGAQGGDATGSDGSTRVGGYGGYSTGVVELKKDETLYIGVGGKGVTGTSTSTQNGGYNGGGNGLYHGGSGGGATHISTSRKVLSNLSKGDVLIVAGGGGGAAVTNSVNCSDGGHAGGYIGNSANVNACTDTLGANGYGTGGTQGAGGGSSATGATGSFGLGASYNQTNSSYGTGGGGGGLYGGGASTLAGAGGGSGYVGNERLLTYSSIKKGMYCYNCQTSDDASIFTGSVAVVSDTPTSKTAKTGAGYARITPLVIYEEAIPQPVLAVNFDYSKYVVSKGYSPSIDYNSGVTAKNDKNEVVSIEKIYILPDNFNIAVNGTYNINYVVSDGKYMGIGTRTVVVQDPVAQSFSYTGGSQTYTVPNNGVYKLEVWGAQGGYRNSSTYGGTGGYASGEIGLTQGTKIYAYVGGSGNSVTTSTNSIYAGGYNGGGYRYGYNGGGGATDFRLTGGAWNDSASLLSRFIVAGGGGSDGAKTKKGMYGGGSDGGSSTENYTANKNYCGKGGTQTYSGYSTSYTVTTQATTGLKSNTTGNYGGGFGFGGGGVYLSSGYGGAGGGGWYGGSGSVPDGSSDDDRGGGGGSGFVWSDATKGNVPSGYSVSSSYYLINTSLIAGNSSMPTHDGTSTMTGNIGNGYAKITPLFQSVK